MCCDLVLLVQEDTGVNVVISSQIGLTLLRDAWMLPYKQYGNMLSSSFFFFLLVKLEYVATEGIHWVEFFPYVNL